MGDHIKQYYEGENPESEASSEITDAIFSASQCHGGDNTYEI